MPALVSHPLLNGDLLLLAALNRQVSSCKMWCAEHTAHLFYMKSGKTKCPEIVAGKTPEHSLDPRKVDILQVMHLQGHSKVPTEPTFSISLLDHIDSLTGAIYRACSKSKMPSCTEAQADVMGSRPEFELSLDTSAHTRTLLLPLIA